MKFLKSLKELGFIIGGIVLVIILSIAGIMVLVIIYLFCFFAMILTIINNLIALCAFVLRRRDENKRNQASPRN